MVGSTIRTLFKTHIWKQPGDYPIIFKILPCLSSCGFDTLPVRKLVDVHRRHLGAKQRDAGQEVSLHRGALPAATSVSLAAQLLGRLTSASSAAVRAETRLRVQEELNQMDPTDREVLALRHFEQLSNPEIAQTLGISESGARSRYLRALKRLKDSLTGIPGLWEQQ